MKRCFGYLRVSTHKQGDGASLETQKNAILDFAAQNGIEIIGWFEERRSAAKTGRPEFSRMLRQLRNGAADGVVIYKIDRSARNFADWAEVGALADAGIDVFFATESLDFNSRGGRLAADIQAVIAADFIRNHRANVVAGQNTRLSNGFYPFKAPLGYLDQGRGKHKIIDPTRGALVRQMFELYAAGNHGLWSLAEEMAARGLRNHWGKPVTKTHVEKILKNPFYMGVILIARSGETYQGGHEPLVSVSLFEAEQRMRADRDNKKSTRHGFLYRGAIFACGLCQTAMIGERQKGHIYYRCHTKTCPTKGIREEALTKAVAACLKPAQLSTADHERLVKLFEPVAARLEADPERERAPLELARIAERKSRITDKLLDGLIEDDDYIARKGVLDTEERRWLEIKERTQEKADLRGKLETFLERAKSLYLSYEIAKPDQKREILRLATSNRKVELRSVYIEPDSWLQILSNIAKLARCEQHRPTSRTNEELEKLAEEINSSISAHGLAEFPDRNSSTKSAQTCISSTR